jgi:type IV pilus assembly protein PilX
MVLLVLSLLALAIIQVVTMQERMARNLRDQSIAFQAAEAALRRGEAQVVSGTASGDPFLFGRFTTTCAGVAGNCLPSTSTTPVWLTAGRWDVGSLSSVAVPTTAFTVPAGVVQPRYIIELISGRPVNDPSTGCTAALFRISARGFGQNNAVVNLQSLYRYRVNNC